MRRIASTLLAAALPLSLLAFAPSMDESESGSTPEATENGSSTVTPEPVEVTMYLHGDDEVARVDENAYAGNSSGILTMDRTAPDGDYETKQITNYVQGPNARCAGNGLLPVWVGYVGKGTITGTATLDLTVVGSIGGEVIVDVFTDVSGQACNEAYPTPATSTTVALPVGEGDISVPLELDGVSPDFQLMVQIRGADSANAVDNPQPNPGAPIWPSRIAPTDPTGQGRVVYDGVDFQSALTFTCQPDDVTFDEDGKPDHAADCMPY